MGSGNTAAWVLSGRGGQGPEGKSGMRTGILAATGGDDAGIVPGGVKVLRPCASSATAAAGEGVVGTES